MPLPLNATWSFGIALIQTLMNCRVTDFRVFVYVHVTSPSGIVNVDPGVLPESVAPTQATVVV